MKRKELTETFIVNKLPRLTYCIFLFKILFHRNFNSNHCEFVCLLVAQLHAESAWEGVNMCIKIMFSWLGTMQLL